MKLKRVLLASSVLALTAALGGCMEIGDLSEEKAELVAQYSAGVLLRYSEDYDKRLISRQQTEEIGEDEPTPVPEITNPPIAVSGTGVSSVPQVTSGQKASDADASLTADRADTDTAAAVKLSELYDIKGVKFAYRSYHFCKKYQENARMAPITAEEGREKLVVKVKVKNVSGESKKINLIGKAFSYELDVDGTVYKPEISILTNGGLNYLKTTLRKAESETAVLIFDVPAGQKKASDIRLTVKKGKKKSVVRIK